MQFADYIYVDDYGYNNFETIKEHIEKRKKYIPNPFYVLILNEYNSQIEFMEFMYLLQQHYKKREPLIVGIAETYESAELLACHMVENCMIKVKDLDYIAYLSSLPEISEDEVLPKLLRISGGKMYA